MFRHPSYYKKLRERNKSGRVISEQQATASSMRAPGPGQQLGEVQPCDRKATPSSKLQAREDSTANSTRGQVAEPQASSSKQQASSRKRLEAVE